MSFSKAHPETFFSAPSEDIAGWSSMASFFASPANPPLVASTEPDNGSGLLSPFDMHLCPPTDLFLRDDGALVASSPPEFGYFLSEMPMLSPSFLNPNHAFLPFTPTSDHIPLLSYPRGLSTEASQDKHIMQSQAYPSPLELPSSTLTSADLRIDGLFSSNVELFPSSLMDDDNEPLGTHKQTHSTTQAQNMTVWNEEEVVDRTPELDASWPYIMHHFSGSTSTLYSNNSVVFYTMPNSPESTTIYSPISTHTVAPEYYYETDSQTEILMNATTDYINTSTNTNTTTTTTTTNNNNNNNVEFNNEAEQSSPVAALLVDLENAISLAQQGVECDFETLQLRAYSLIHQSTLHNDCGIQEKRKVHDTLTILLRTISPHTNEPTFEQAEECKQELPHSYECPQHRNDSPDSPISTLSDFKEDLTFLESGSPHACQELAQPEKQSTDNLDLADSETDDDGDFCLSTASSDDEYEESSGRPLRKVSKRADRRSNPTGNLRKRARKLSLASHESSCGSLRPQAETRSRINQTSRKTRKNYSKDTTRVLMDWYLLHDGETPDSNNKERLASLTNKTPAQISTWFQNARRRHSDKLQQFKFLVASHPTVVYDYASFVAYEP
ncbi:hypothetical protein F4703DRAFT_1839668 [Phycomyces blakesleeanus]